MHLSNSASDIPVVSKETRGRLDVVKSCEVVSVIGQAVLFVLVSMETSGDDRAAGAAAKAFSNLVPSLASWSSCGVLILVAP